MWGKKEKNLHNISQIVYNYDKFSYTDIFRNLSSK